MHWHDRPGARGDRPSDQRLIQIERIVPDIDEDRPSSSAYDRVGRGYKSKRRKNDLVVGLEVAELDGYLERGGAGRRHQDLRRVEALFEEPGAAASKLALGSDRSVR